MGCHENISASKFPKQSECVGKTCMVVFHYDTKQKFPATIIRDDNEEPFETIFKLEDGRVVRSTECQWQPP